MAGATVNGSLPLYNDFQFPSFLLVLPLSLFSTVIQATPTQLWSLSLLWIVISKGWKVVLWEREKRKQTHTAIIPTFLFPTIFYIFLYCQLCGPVLPPFRFLAFPNHFSLLHPSSSQGCERSPCRSAESIRLHFISCWSRLWSLTPCDFSFWSGCFFVLFAFFLSGFCLFGHILYLSASDSIGALIWLVHGTYPFCVFLLYPVLFLVDPFN